MMVTQKHARHSLIKTTKVMSDAKAEERLKQLRQRLVNGADFAELAKRNSDDVSAPQGGDLGWLTPGETVRSEEHTSELQSLMLISYAAFCYKKKNMGPNV